MVEYRMRDGCDGESLKLKEPSPIVATSNSGMKLNGRHFKNYQDTSTSGGYS